MIKWVSATFSNFVPPCFPLASGSFSGFEVDPALVAFSHSDHQYPDHVVFDLIDKPVTGSFQLDLEVILKTAEAVRRDIRILKKI